MGHANPPCPGSQLIRAGRGNSVSPSCAFRQVESILRAATGPGDGLWDGLLKDRLAGRRLPKTSENPLPNDRRAVARAVARVASPGR